MAGLNILRGLTGNVKSAVGHVGNATKSMGTAGNLIWDNKINAGLATANAVWTYNDTLDEGGTKANAIQDAAFSMGTDLLLGPLAGMAVQAAYYGGPALVGIANDLAQQGRQQMQQSYRPFSWTNPVNSQQYATMRQAGMALVQQSQYSLQTTMMGQEGKAFHK